MTRLFTGTKISMILLMIAGITVHDISGNEQILADPDLIGCAFEYHGTVQAKAGGGFTAGEFTFGGFIEARNEPLFNQGLLPNHNWRGFVASEMRFSIIRQLQYHLQYITGIHHESAHATMGIYESPDSYFARIYDHSYRKYALNSFVNGAEFSIFDKRNRLILKTGLENFILSKNTPELPGLESGYSFGMTFGCNYRYLLSSRRAVFVSFYERFIVKGSKNVYGDVWDNEGIKNEKYPIMNTAPTFTITGGGSVPLYKARKSLNFFIRYFYGHGYGYIDSRKRCNFISTGLIIGDFLH